MAMIILLALMLNINLLFPLTGRGGLVAAKKSVYLDLNQYRGLKLKLEKSEQIKKKKNVYITRKTKNKSPEPSEKLKEMFNKYGGEYKVDKKILKKIAYCESNFNSKAVNGPYAGMYQFLASTWISNRKAMGLDSNPNLRFEAEESIKTTAYKISHDGTGAWPVCGR